MNKEVVKKCFLHTTLIAAAWFSGHSSAFAEGHTLTIHEPESVWLKFNEKEVASYSNGLHTPADSSVTADLKFRAHCPEDYVVSSIIVYDEYRKDNRTLRTGNSIEDNHRTEYLTLEDLTISTIADLHMRCSTVQGGGTYGINIPIQADLYCYDPPSLTDPIDNNRWSDRTYHLELPIKVTCGLTMANATVEDEFWSYLCPETPRDDEVFWQKYRLVVDGTDSNQVRTSTSLGEPYCVPFSKSDGSQMNTVTWKAD